MNRIPVIRTTDRHLLGYALVAALFLPLQTHAASVVLATQPLATSTASNVKPNIMFILDDSGSMDSDFLPDWATSGNPVYLFHNAAFNGVYYNPAITYLPPVYYTSTGALDAATYPSQDGTSVAKGGGSVATPNWNVVKDDGYGKQSASTSNLVGSANFYTIIPGEYCTAADLKTCIAASGPSGLYIYAAPIRFCNTTTNAALATPPAGACQAIRTTGFLRVRDPRPNFSTITIATPTTTATSVSSITVGGTQILSATAPSTASTSTTVVAQAIADSINACSAWKTGACGIDGFSATVSGSTVTITARSTGVFSTPVVTKSGSMTISASTFAGGNNVPGSNRYNDILQSIPNYFYPGTPGKSSTRTDCAGATCTYKEELTNYANWWTYYHTRMQAMKTSVSRAFKSLDNRYRVGFTTISNTGVTNNASFLGNNTFELTHKYNWFTILFAQGTPSWTPLRGAISKAGRYYAKRFAGQVDPVQYSCQQNFTILSTDGYWNTDTETATYGPYNLTGGSVGNLDGGTTPRPLKEGTTATSNTLADVSKYYYDTDLRDASLGNCAGGTSPDYPSGNPNVCDNNVYTSSTDSKPEQHMTTFTMGLGADGLLNYQTDYDTASSGDFYNLKNGYLSTNWPDPIANTSEARIDDLWHAAVNGHGTYFSAKDPNQIITGFQNALSSITSKLGSAAAAATSTLNPVSGNNLAFVASYTTVKWKGNLEARTIDVNSGQVSETASWCVENVLQGSCASAPIPITSGSSTVYYCETTGATAVSCTLPDIYNSSTGTCRTEIQNACIGKMRSQVTTSSDTRNIYTSVSGVLTPFTAANFGSDTNFSAAKLIGLNQWGTYTASQQTAAAGNNLVNYLRGQSGYEISATTAVNRLYRTREATLGDALESQPAYIGKPTFNYPYTGYNAFKNGSASTRSGMVYMGTNDGMLHAFYAKDGTGATYNSATPPACIVGGGGPCGGEEAWAYIPNMVLPNLWKLASTSYSTNHVNYVNGSPVISDVYCTTNCGGVVGGAAGWRTILVGGLNGGGRGYYALDITTPATPILLWEFTPSKASPLGDADLGYSFGRPAITRLANDTWVVLVTSGYDNGALSGDGVTANAPVGDGLGHLYVLDAISGAKISKINTSAGSTASPSGLAQIAVWNDEPAGNKAGYVYGGDLEGNLWRFDVNTAVTPFLLSKFYDSTYIRTQPITTTPILGLVTPTSGGADQRVVYVGTGKYLETSDLTNPFTQSFYAIKDDGTSIVNPRSHTTSPHKVVQQVITVSGNTRVETLSPNAVDLATDSGWFIDLPDSSSGSERVNIDGKLVAGTLIIPTLVPSASVCSPGGWGWLNYFNYANGWPVRDSTAAGSLNVNVSVKYDATIVGINVIYIKGKPVVEVVTSVDPTPSRPTVAPLFDIIKSNYQGSRSVWRELIP